MPLSERISGIFVYLGTTTSGLSTTCTETSSGLHREFWSDLTASSAVNLPITRASLRLGVIWMGVRSIRCTYSVARVLPRFTFTTNFVFFIVSHCFDYTRVSAFIAPKLRRIGWNLLHGLGLRVTTTPPGCLHN